MTVTYTHPRPEMLGYLPPHALSVLDVGCSSGEFGKQLLATANVRLVGVEPNQVAADLASKIYHHVVVGLFPDVRDELDPGERFDAIYFNDVLEHMTEPEAALRAARELLAPEGVVIASIPNIRHLSVLGPLILRDEFRYRETGILDRTHFRFFTKRSIARMFADEGWTIERLEGINRVLRIAEDKRRRWIELLGRASRGRTDGFFFVQYVVVARPDGSRPEL